MKSRSRVGTRGRDEGHDGSRIHDSAEVPARQRPITYTIDAAAFKRAMEMATGGPEIMSTAQAAMVFGFSTKRWRRWAEAGRVAGAWEDGEDGKRGTWRLPRESCQRVVEEEAAKGRARARDTRAKQGIANAGRTTATSGGRRVGLASEPVITDRKECSPWPAQSVRTLRRRPGRSRSDGMTRNPWGPAYSRTGSITRSTSGGSAWDGDQGPAARTAVTSG